MIKFNDINEKSKKIKSAIELLNKHGGVGNLTWGSWTVQSNNNVNNVNNWSTWTVNTNTNGSGISPLCGTTTNTNIFNSITTNPSSVINNTSPITTITTNNTGIFSNGIGNNITIGGNGISTGISNGNNAFVGYSSVTYTHKLLGLDVDLGYLPNAELIVSLINLLGAEFWDEYKSQNDLSAYYPNAYNIIEETLKPHRRDKKIDDIISYKNKK